MLHFASAAAGGEGLAGFVQEAAQAAIKARPFQANSGCRGKPQHPHCMSRSCPYRAWLVQERGAFTLVLSGGSLFKALSPLVGLRCADFGKWHIFFVDERNVPHSSPDSNFKGADEALLSKVGACCCVDRELWPLRQLSVPCNALHALMGVVCAGPHPTSADICHQGESAC